MIQGKWQHLGCGCKAAKICRKCVSWIWNHCIFDDKGTHSRCLGCYLSLITFASRVFTKKIKLIHQWNHLLYTIWVLNSVFIPFGNTPSSKANFSTGCSQKKDLSAPYHRLVKDPFFVNTLYISLANFGK